MYNYAIVHKSRITTITPLCIRSLWIHITYIARACTQSAARKLRKATMRLLEQSSP